MEYFENIEAIITELLDDSENRVIKEFSKLLGIKPMQLIEQNKNRRLSDMRQLYCKLRYEMHGISYTKIGREISRSHTAVKYGVTRINDLLLIEDPEVVPMWRKVRYIPGFYL